MPTTEADFHLVVDRAAGLTADAACAARFARAGPLPTPHRQLLVSAIRSLEAAQQALYIARHDPWSHPKPKRRQMELL